MRNAGAWHGRMERGRRRARDAIAGAEDIGADDSVAGSDIAGGVARMLVARVAVGRLRPSQRTHAARGRGDAPPAAVAVTPLQGTARGVDGLPDLSRAHFVK